ncbi:MAG TPA: hypothetical protein GX700_16710 [Paracoccus sp.]|nr:hypothetical protein [Paracoccus sp. (in: a-proteobacteria)]
MKHQSYYNRALRAQDRRYARVFEKLGYGTRDMVSAEPEVDDLTALRAEYQDVVGKRAYHGWSADDLRDKIAEAGE